MPEGQEKQPKKRSSRLFLYGGLLFLLLVAIFYFSGGLARSSANGKANSQTAIPARAKPTRITVHGIYLTAYSAGSQKKVDHIIASIKGTKVNAVVIDIKDYTGYLSYDSNIHLVNDLKLKQIKIKDLKGVIDKLHQNHLYVIARMAVFQDPALAQARPSWAVFSKKTNKVWVDNKGISWLDPANPEVWKYHVNIAKEAIALGFDEINLDYVRFPSDGAVSDMRFPYFDKMASTTPSSTVAITSTSTTGAAAAATSSVIVYPKAEVIKNFFHYFSDNLKNQPAYLSVDLFGLTTTVTKGDMNIGQVLENAAPYFDYICPMVYPSHYPNGYMKFSNPADHPYEVISQAIKVGNERLKAASSTRAVLRPWIQDFDLGAFYTADMIKKEIKASEDNGGDGWLVWDPKNLYTWGGLQ